MCIDHVVDKAEGVGFAVRRHELRRRGNIFAVGHVQSPQPAVPGSDVNRVLARCVGWPDDRRGCDTARTQHVVLPAARRGFPGAFKAFTPQQLALFDVDRENVVRHPGDDGDFLGTAVGCHAPDDQGREQRVHLPRFVVELHLPKQLHLADVGLFQDGFILLPGGALRIAAIGQPVSSPGRPAAGEDQDHSQYHSHSENTPFQNPFTENASWDRLVVKKSRVVQTFCIDTFYTAYTAGGIVS